MANANPEDAGGCFTASRQNGRYTVVSVDRRRLLFILLPALATAAALGPITAGAVDVSPLNCAGPNACDIVGIYIGIFIIAMAVLVIVGGLLLYAALRFRRRDDREPDQVHGNTRLEIIWTAIPVLIVSFLFVRTTLRMDYVRNGPTPDLTVQVTGIQWAWSYKYPNGKTSNGTMTIPVGRVVRLQVTSRDVLHAFWVPRLGGQVYAIPGQTNHGWIEASQPGKYYGECNELCGLAHYAMSIEVDAVSQSDYEAFLAGKVPPGAGPALGEKVSGATAASNVSENDALKFQPGNATVKVGDVVQWTNDGTAAHNVTFDNKAVPSSETQNGGDKYEVKFLKAGTYSYVCTFHVAAGMKGTITVTGG
jgi:cytochrome c oxidase subunit II